MAASTSGSGNENQSGNVGSDGLARGRIPQGKQSYKTQQCVAFIFVGHKHTNNNKSQKGFKSDADCLGSTWPSLDLKPCSICLNAKTHPPRAFRSNLSI